MSRYVMSIDAGTTGITVLTVDEDGRVGNKAYTEFPQHFPRPGWVEHDPEEIWHATLTTIEACLAQAGIANVSAIGITNQRETTVVWERSTLRPVYNAIVWQDRRTAAICDRLRAEGLEKQIRATTGLVLDPYFSATKLVWLFENEPSIQRLAEQGKLAFGTIDSWLIAKLTEGREHLTDATNASRTLLFSLEDGSWDEKLLNIFGVPRTMLAEVRASSGDFGSASAGPFSTQPVPIRGVAGDQQAALFGQACFDPGMSKNTYGTGSFVLTNTGADRTISSRGLLTSVAWELGGVMTYALEGAIFVTGAAIQWLRDGLGLIAGAAETGPLAASVETTDGVYFVPALTGLGAPYWDPHARGAITGLTRGTTRAHIARAAVEAMAYQTRDVVDVMTGESGVPLAELRVDGGASVMDVLCQFQADILGVEVARSATAETTAMGAAFLAGLSSGTWSDTEEVSLIWRADRRFEPQMPAAQRAELYEGWKTAVDRTLVSPASPLPGS